MKRPWRPNFFRIPEQFEAIRVDLSNLRQIRKIGFKIRLEKRDDLWPSIRRNRIWVKKGDGSETFALSGDWLVRQKDGKCTTLTHHRFMKTFRPL